jgi:hypothetical protein
MLSDFTLYKYSEQSNSYVTIYTLPYANRFEMYNYDNRIIIVGASSGWDYSTGGMSQKLTENIYVLIDNDGIVSVIDIITFSLNINSTDPYGSWVPVTVSPKLSKFYYQYTNLYSTVPTIGIKTVDYVNYYVYDVTIIDEVQFTETVKSLNNSTNNNTFSFNSSNTSSCNIKLGDRFFIVRNDTPVSNNSTYNNSNSTNSSTVPPVYVE